MASTQDSRLHIPPALQRTATSLVQDANAVLTQSSKVIDCLVSDTTPDNASFANFVRPLLHDENIRILHCNSSVIHDSTSSDAVLREAAATVRQLYQNFETALFMRYDVSIRCENVRQKETDLSPESSHLLEVFHQVFQRNGASTQPTKDKARVQEISQSLAKLQSEFRENIQTADACLWLDPADLRGVPQSAIDGLHHGADGRVLLSHNEIQSGLFFSEPESSDVRRKIWYAKETLHRANRPIFDEIVAHRAERARLLGYSSHAALRISERLAETPETVSSFLSDLASGLRETGKREVDVLREMKRADLHGRGEPFDGKLWLWDVSHYHQKLVAHKFSFGGVTISEYFPLTSVLDKALGLLGRLFGLRFADVPGPGGRDIDVIARSYIWHQDVQLLGAWNSEDQSEFLGFLYLDLFSRPGKTGSPSHHNIVPGFTREDGHRQYPHSAILSAYSRPSNGGPYLLRYSGVSLLLHELGHAVHDLVSNTQYARFHGPEGTPVDFGEFPSQLLEGVVRIPSVIYEISQHSSTLQKNKHNALTGQSQDEGPIVVPSEKMPEEAIRILLQRQKVNEAVQNLNQIGLAKFDLEVHQIPSRRDVEAKDIPALFGAIRRETYPADTPDANDDQPEWGGYYASFNHFVHEYDAGFYSYLFSQSIAEDVLETLGGNTLSAEAFRRYRHVVLEKGGSRPGMEVLREFLGREPMTDAFCRHLGSR